MSYKVETTYSKWWQEVAKSDPVIVSDEEVVETPILVGAYTGITDISVITGPKGVQIKEIDYPTWEHPNGRSRLETPKQPPFETTIPQIIGALHVKVTKED